MPIGKDHYFGAAGQTDIHPAALLILCLAAVLLWVLPRKYAFIPLLVAAVFIPAQQVVIVAGLHLTLTRVLIGCAWLRLMWVRFVQRRLAMPAWRGLDSAMVAYYVTGVVTFYLLWGESGAIINRLGLLYNALGIYFFMRYALRDARDLDRMAKTLAGIMVVVALFMALEQATGRNLFSVFGGVTEFTEIRDGKLRSQGPFAHPLTAGAIGATLVPMMAGLWWQRRRNKITALAGGVAGVVMAVTSMTSTSLAVLAAGLLALCMWPLRRHLRLFRWATVAVMVMLHLVMKAPVWALISRIDLTGSSSSYHRYQLVDQFIRRFGEWWMVGTQNTVHWGWDMWDTINSYVAAGTDGGIVGFVLFVSILVVAFRGLGMARKAAAADPEHERRLWVLGTVLFANAMAFFGIRFFDQSSFLWYAELAMFATAMSLRVASTAASTVPSGSLLAPLPEEECGIAEQPSVLVG